MSIRLRKVLNTTAWTAAICLLLVGALAVVSALWIPKVRLSDKHWEGFRQHEVRTILRVINVDAARLQQGRALMSKGYTPNQAVAELIHEDPGIDVSSDSWGGQTPYRSG